MLRRALVLRHVLHEDLGAFASVLSEAGWSVAVADTPIEGVQRGRVAEADLLVVMGGPCAAYEGEHHPWLGAEIEAIREHVTAGKPTLGICLGAQLIAAALGARVYPGQAGAEIGWGAVELTDAGRAGALAALEGVPLLHWHGDTFDLPEGATLLASTPAYINQTFAIGPNILGLQFHPEVDGTGIEHWLLAAPEFAGREALRAGARAHGPGAARAGAAMLRGWLAGLRG